MAHLVVKDGRLYTNQWDLSSHLTGIGVSLSQDAVEATTMGNNSRLYLPGLKSGSVTHSALTDFADDASYEIVSGMTSTVVFSATADGDTEGTRTALGRFIKTNWGPMDASIGDVAGFQLSGQPTGVVAGGYVLHPKTARTSTSTTTGVQAGAIAAGQTGYAALHVFSGTASTLDVVIQSDTVGFPSPTSRITFTQASGATSQWATVAGPVTDDYWRVSYTVGGGTWTFAVTFGIA